ncbi:MAG: aldo/keto reductase, partial [Mycobacterium sp.]|nr:aldo/keto reductase [Mycobacterium sp.]
DSRLSVWGMTGSLTSERFDVVEALQTYAAERGITLTDVAIGALAAQPMVSSVIAGATSPEQVKANVAAAEWYPSDEDLAELDKIVPSQRPRS